MRWLLRGNDLGPGVDMLDILSKAYQCCERDDSGRYPALHCPGVPSPNRRS